MASNARNACKKNSQILLTPGGGLAYQGKVGVSCVSELKTTGEAAFVGCMQSFFAAHGIKTLQGLTQCLEGPGTPVHDLPGGEGFQGFRPYFFLFFIHQVSAKVWMPLSRRGLEDWLFGHLFMGLGLKGELYLHHTLPFPLQPEAQNPSKA